MQSFLFSLPIAINFLFFLILAIGIWFAGSRLTYLADTISDRLNLASSTVGLVFLAVATSLPEIATTLSAAVRQNADLLLNNLFGGIVLQTAILALADFWAKGAISNYPRKAIHALEATLLVGLLAGLQIIFIIGEPVSWLNIGLGSLLIAIAYVGALQLLRWYDDRSDWMPVDLPDIDVDALTPIGRLSLGDISNTGLWITGIFACLGILFMGVIIVEVSEVLALQSGLGAGFLGVTLLAAATSLPELSTTITAVRIGSYTLAISNIFGSNLIMIVLVLPADILHTSGPILATGNALTHLALASGILVTAIYLSGLIVRRKPTVGSIGLDSFLVFLVYGTSLILFFILK